MYEGNPYVWRRPDLKAVLFMLFLVGTFGLNFAIFISTMSVTVFHTGAGQYGLATSMMAIGSVTGALLAARRANPDITLLLTSAAFFGVGCALAAIMPSYGLFDAALVVVGVAAQTLTTSTNSFVQLSTEPSMRGWVGSRVGFWCDDCRDTLSRDAPTCRSFILSGVIVPRIRKRIPQALNLLECRQIPLIGSAPLQR